MYRSFGVLAGIAVALTVLGSCDDRDSARLARKSTKGDEAAAPARSARLGGGWYAVSDMHKSRWGFGSKPAMAQAGMQATQSDAQSSGASGASASVDALSAIRAALMANMLPARGSVRIEDLISRATSSIEPAASEAAAQKPRAILATTPWNDDTLLLWVEVPGGPAADGSAISVEFDPKTVSAFRPLGDLSALPSPSSSLDGGAPGRVAVIYELLPRPDSKGGPPRPTLQYAVLHIGARAGVGAPKVELPITAADAVGTIDNAPDVVRLAAAAAGFGELLRGNPAVRDLSCNDVIALAQSVRRPDPDGWRARLIALMYRAQPLIDLPPSEPNR